MQLEELTVTLGEETLQPFRYEGFRVGPITVKVKLDKGEGIHDAISRIITTLHPAWDELFIKSRDKFHEHHAAKM